jgi:hypothetical protein
VPAIQHRFATELIGESGVVCAEIISGRNGLASAAIAKPCGAERSQIADAGSVTPSIARAPRSVDRSIVEEVCAGDDRELAAKLWSA